jgi:trehalose 6-phosphate phosphatase
VKKAEPKLVFLLDYDGTLTDFDRNPDHSRLTPETRSLLLRLSRKYPVFLVSGRNVKSLRKVSGLKKLPMVGSHGFESSRLPGGLRFAGAGKQKRFRHEAALLYKAFQRLKKEFPGLHVEPKPFSSTVHYRGLSLSARQEKTLKRQFRRLVRQTVTPNLWSLQEGKKMLEAKPKGFSKGQAVLKIMKLFPGALPLYAGDDITDISAFKALGSKGLKVSVGDRIAKNLVNLLFHNPREFVYWLKAFL